MNNLCKVMDAKTGRLKRWESHNGKPLAIVKNRRLSLTKNGERLGYKVTRNHLVEGG